MKPQHKTLILFVVMFFFTMPAWSQFYNGLQQQYGKNRVQYKQFEWLSYRFDRFDTYFYTDGMELAQYLSVYAEKRIEHWENFFNISLNSRIIFLVYNKQSDFKQSNIGLQIGDDKTGLAGIDLLSDNKAYVYFNGDHREFEHDIDARIIEMLINQSMFGGNFSERVASRTLIDVPDWYIKGLVWYLSHGLTPEDEAKIIDKFRTKRFRRLSGLTPEEERLAGVAIWHYLVTEFDENLIPNILYLTKAHRNYEAGFDFVLGEDFDVFLDIWRDYYYKRIDADAKDRVALPTDKLLKHTRKSLVYQHPTLSPNGKTLAYVSQNEGRYKIWLRDIATGKRTRIYAREHKLQQITDYSYPYIAWNPKSNTLAFVTEEKGFLWLNFYQTETEELTQRYLPVLDKVGRFSYSDDGLNLVMSATEKGRTDIFMYNIPSRNITPVTQDMADDFDPVFANNSKQILFSSTRKGTELVAEPRPFLWAENPMGNNNKQTDLFLYDYKNKALKLTQITNTETDESQSTSPSPNKYIYLSSQNGIVNKYLAQYDSTISFIDTAIHYRYFSLVRPLTNYPTSIFEHSASNNGKTASMVYQKKRLNILASDPQIDTLTQLPLTQLAKQRAKRNALKVRQELASLAQRAREQARIDSIRANTKVENPSELPIQVGSYVFENEKIVAYQTSPLVDSIVNTKKQKTDRPGMFNYLTAFYNDQMAVQANLSFANEFYQSYTGSYFNPGINFAIQVGIKDLFEDTRFVGGFFISPDFTSYNYLLGLQLLKKRWDKQFYFQEQSYKSYYTNQYNYQFQVAQKLYKLTHISSYPLSQVAAVKATVAVRYDRSIFLTQDVATLQEPDIRDYWANLKLEYVFDNSYTHGVNIYSGAKLKYWAEYHRQIDGSKTEMFVLGLDLRYNLPIHGNIIWANRIGASTSFGKARLLYYLGAVDNWWNFSNNPTFDATTPINQTINYQFQANATNMRGFSQNVRNGTTFAVINSEIRWPIFSYFSTRRLKMAMLRDFQLMSFLDIGSAWNGASPFDKTNAYNFEEIDQNGVIITINKRRSPILVGYGFGMRTTLLGYYVRADWSWGIDDWTRLPRVFYLSLGYDF